MSKLFLRVRWSIWKQRNDLIWRNETVTRIAVVSKMLKHVVMQQHFSIHRWKKPDLGRYKCNVGAAFSKVSNRVGISMCIRDDQGSFVLTKTKWVLPILKVDVLESLGLLFAIRWLTDLHRV